MTVQKDRLEELRTVQESLVELSKAQHSPGQLRRAEQRSEQDGQENNETPTNAETKLSQRAINIITQRETEILLRQLSHHIAQNDTNTH